jgi:hypothetical protein
MRRRAEIAACLRAHSWDCLVSAKMLSRSDAVEWRPVSLKLAGSLKATKNAPLCQITPTPETEPGSVSDPCSEALTLTLLAILT